MSAPLLRDGWEIAFHPQLFAAQYDELRAEVRASHESWIPYSNVATFQESYISKS